MSQGEAFKACEEALAQGDSVWFFPEGTRTPDGHIQSFRPGAFRLSQQTGAPILPIVLWGTREFNPKGTLSIGSGMARLMVLDPVLSEAGETAEAFTSRVREMMVRVYQAG
jgi:1-acyl-sn-glycerol-3-phosphate acyltransferase